jgi:hypothetical protein
MSLRPEKLDCFVALLLAMTLGASTDAKRMIFGGFESLVKGIMSLRVSSGLPHIRQIDNLG